MTDASETFDRLGNETRMAVLEALVDDGRPVERTFTDLFEATEEESDAGFAYHLRRLRGHYVEQTDGGYRLTYAGQQVVRAVAAGTYTESVAPDRVDVPDDCPFCGEPDLVATGADNVLTVGCDACDRDVLALPFPPGGHATQSDLLDAFDAHHRHRIALLRDGAWPECGGAVTTTVAAADEHAQAGLACGGCGYALPVPVTLTVRSHPAVVSLYHEHGEDVRERPLWNVGAKWSETVLSADPVCVRIATEVGGDLLALLVGADGTVAHVDRSPVEVEPEEGTDGAAA